jgi:hypothetical protein
MEAANVILHILNIVAARTAGPGKVNAIRPQVGPMVAVGREPSDAE